jgi:hypothetical protein
MLQLAAPHTELAQCLELAKAAQITTDYRNLVCDSAGPLLNIVHQVFPGHLQFIYLITDDNRRQVWNAHMSAPSIAAGLSWLAPAELAQYRYRLLTEGSQALIREAYGSTCEGLISLYGKLGRVALSGEFYSRFHRLVSNNLELRRSLFHSPAIEPALIELLFDMPPPLQSYHFAKEVGTEHAMKQFRDLFLFILSSDFKDKEALIDRLIRGVRVGKAYREPLRKIFHALSFPPQVVPNKGPLRFIPAGAELASVARRYNNCMARYVSLAVTGERQFYEWKGSTPAVIGLRRYRVSTWYIEEIKLKDNAEPPFVLVKEIHDHFANYGIDDKRWCQIDAFDRFLVEDDNEDDMNLEHGLFRGLQAA